MGIAIQAKKSKKSKIKRLKCLPRLSLNIDFMGYDINLKYVPVVETLYQSLTSGAYKKELLKTIETQFKETP